MTDPVAELTGRFQTAWHDLGPPARRALELAYAPTGRELADCTLLSTQEPCSMCTAAAAFLTVGAVRHLAPDPWALASGQPGNDSSDGPAADL